MSGGIERTMAHPRTDFNFPFGVGDVSMVCAREQVLSGTGDTELDREEHPIGCQEQPLPWSRRGPARREGIRRSLPCGEPMRTH